MPVFEYTVDDEPQFTTEHTLTSTQILKNAGIDSTNHYEEIVAFIASVIEYV